MSSSKKEQGSMGPAVVVAAVVVIALVSLGYYQYVYAPSLPTSSTATTTFTGKLVQINITVGAATKTTDAYSPNPVKLVIGVNNTFVVYNGDMQGGVGVPHSYTARNGAFDTGVLQAGSTSNLITVTTPGTYDVYCVVHPTTMRGTLIVVAATGGVKTQSSGSSSSASATSQSGSITSSTNTSTTSATNTTASSPAVASAVKGVVMNMPSGAGTRNSSVGYEPVTITVVLGVNNAVTWMNLDSLPHTVTAKDGSFNSNEVGVGD